jgi:hypothetical protein
LCPDESPPPHTDLNAKEINAIVHLVTLLFCSALLLTSGLVGGVVFCLNCHKRVAILNRRTSLSLVAPIEQHRMMFLLGFSVTQANGLVGRVSL